VFEFLFKYRPVLFERGRLELGVHWLLALAVLLALALATPTLLRYARAAGRTDRLRRGVLIGLRIAALGAILSSSCAGRRSSSPPWSPSSPSSGSWWTTR
jgi:hypothetical protein